MSFDNIKFTLKQLIQLSIKTNSLKKKMQLRVNVTQVNDKGSLTEIAVTGIHFA